MKQEHPALRHRSLSDFHESLLQLILARVDVYSLPSCAQVCKTWSLIITRSHTFARLHASLHSSHTCFTLFSSPYRDSMVVYDTLASRCMSMPSLDLGGDEPPIDTGCIPSENWEQLKRLRQILFDEELLATAAGLVLSRSEYSNVFSVTNIVTRKSKHLPSPNPQLCHIAFAGMAYVWATMSYQVLLCGLPRTPNSQGRLLTCVYNSLTHCWANAKSSLDAEISCRLLVKKFARPKSCVWLGGHFYCVMGRALYLFNSETMEWDSVYSLPLRKGPCQPHNKVQVQLPSELVHFYCLWEHEGQLRLAGSVKLEESKFITQLWCYSPSVQTESGASRWQNFAHLPLIARDNGSSIQITCGGESWYAPGDTLCLSIVAEGNYVSYGWIRHTSKVRFYVQDLAKGVINVLKSVRGMVIYRDASLLANLAIQPCPFTSP